MTAVIAQLAALTAAEFELLVYVVVLMIITLSIMIFGFLVMTFGRGAFSALHGVGVGSGVVSLVMLSMSGARMLGAGVLTAGVGLVASIASGVLAWMAHRLERRLIERRARRIGKGGAARKH